jgi:hypothetical protein
MTSALETVTADLSAPIPARSRQCWNYAPTWWEYRMCASPSLSNGIQVSVTRIGGCWRYNRSSKRIASGYRKATQSQASVDTAPPIELAAEGCGWGRHRDHWVDRWGHWHGALRSQLALIAGDIVKVGNPNTRRRETACWRCSIASGCRSRSDRRRIIPLTPVARTATRAPLVQIAQGLLVCWRDRSFVRPLSAVTSPPYYRMG